MKRLILTGWGGGRELARSGLAEIVIPFHFQFEWGPLPRAEKLSAYLAAYAADLGPAEHWSDWVRWPKGTKGRKSSLAEFCERYDEIELWFAATPRDQLQLVWLLDHLGNYPALAQRFAVRLLASDLMFSPDYNFAEAEPDINVMDVGAEEFEIGKSAWSAYCAPTPEACIDLLRRDLSALLMLRPALLDLLAELPSPLTGLGATEMRFLEMLAWYANTNPLFHLRSLRRTDVFGEIELGYLIEGLALGPKPAVAGLGEELRTIDLQNLRARHQVYLRSRLSLTEFGKAVLAHQEDFSRHNPIDRWWGGTHLTNDRLWRYGAVLTKP
ncbi:MULTISPECIES: hypothetical protein [unclassified Bradyrhizobium]|uniref:hypothetical protein n=1 Tax=unclassified Bradyrhizobium TaxID=2631580 RepID=UPI00211EF982|nr:MULTISPECIES: hypothetical protein [unclassified Bradyrhizobium]MDD1532868.1 hypothetical protein [Bradyrhizobium sp. WBOS8]MDD1581780.1 hypothetical protein [Bradyrhizobium sp. WBOS4]UUO50040.1 hypothetical protein DCM78_25890 [Bradyrhizobium sp. WBOS04]UUO58808.1 hypothetical protein DCM80_06170 [Bradyrhizobium sp. WBOS08]